MIRFDRRLLFNFDWILLLAVLLIAGMSLINLYSSTYAGVGSGVFLKQTYFYLLGFVLILAIITLDYRILLAWNYPLYCLIILLLMITFFVGGHIAGTQRWLNLGFFRLQPSEPAKLMLVITLASYYSRKDTGKGFSLKELAVPILLTGLPFCLILIQPDLGTALMLGLIAVTMTLFVKLKWAAPLHFFFDLGSGGIEPVRRF